MAGNQSGANGNGHNSERQFDDLRGQIAELRGALSEAQTALTIAKTKSEQQEADIASIAGTVGSIQDSRQLNIGFISSAIGIIAFVSGALFFVINGQVDAKVAPVLKSQEDTGRALDNVNRTLRDLNAATDATSRMSLTNSLRIDDQQRIDAIMWQRSMGTPFPSAPESR